MVIKAGNNVIAHVGKIILTGVIVSDLEQDCLSIASLDADIFIPIDCCEDVRLCSGIELCKRTRLQHLNATRLKESNFIVGGKVLGNL